MATKDAFDVVPSGTMRSSKRGRIKPTPNPVLSNLKAKSAQLASENAELKERLVQIEAAVEAMTKKAKK